MHLGGKSRRRRIDFPLHTTIKTSRGHKNMSKGGARILVVDHEIEIVRALERSLAPHGFKVFTAGSGEDALEAFIHHRPNVILLDLVLPSISGLQVLKRRQPPPNLPIL